MLGVGGPFEKLSSSRPRLDEERCFVTPYRPINQSLFSTDEQQVGRETIFPIVITRLGFQRTQVRPDTFSD